MNGDVGSLISTCALEVCLNSCLWCKTNLNMQYVRRLSVLCIAIWVITLSLSPTGLWFTAVYQIEQGLVEPKTWTIVVCQFTSSPNGAASSWRPSRAGTGIHTHCIIIKTTSSSMPAYLNNLISCSSSYSAVIRRPTAERTNIRMSFANWVCASVFLVAALHTWSSLSSNVRSCQSYCGHLQPTPQDPSVQS